MDHRLWMTGSPFERETRQNIRSMDPFTYSQGNRQGIALSRVGYLARIHWHFNGTLTVTLGGGTAAIDALGPWNTLQRVRVQANSGTDIYSTSGYGNLLVEEVMATPGRGHLVAEGGRATPLSIAAQVYAAAAASGAQTWDWGATIPIAVNDMSELGLVLLQNELASIQLVYEYNSLIYSLTGAQAPVLVTGAATAALVGTIQPVVEYFAVPVDPAKRPEILWLHQILEKTDPIGAVGDNTINLLRENVYLQILHHVILNNAPNSTDVDRIRMELNTSDVPYDLLKRGALQLARRQRSIDSPLGVYMFDLFNQGLPGYGSERDIINGKATAEFRDIITIASGATLGTNASRINTITRQLVRLAAPAVGGV